jgi:type IV secretion system protein VirB11
MSLMIRESGAGGGLRMDEIKGLLRIVVDVIVQFDRDERGRFIADVAYEPRRRQPPQTQLRASTLLAPESAFGDGAPS